ncbi:single-stranded DNA-binding protein [Flavilitoribacter nigricans]|uniref:Single-stranded DNA-binding protein n=1 Tax=Flavilitoribacter nigricans (strain ATCC 23147 / DSM 23189 / NBRC 102662 / NCIMB 1420 / SS-2) TaxID=1122177 RepID=A0A2D0NBK9_FLAN2|nr:single-stranded DNA-binding protein [Flavilitoribacter nigricans]PHN05867.1 single-stranded DNA-binding protein [Flavilitoribacter nigricans DSM 23189 = NBRC 102662]
MLKTEIIGNLGADAVVRNVNGTTAIGFSVAHNEKYKDSNGVSHEKTLWINCTFWRTKETRLTEYLKKGQMVFVEGTPSVGVYTNRDGQQVADFQLRVNRIELIGSRSDNNQQPTESQHNGQAPKPAARNNGQRQQQRPAVQGNGQQAHRQPVATPVDDVDTSWIDD